MFLDTQLLFFVGQVSEAIVVFEIIGVGDFPNLLIQINFLKVLECFSWVLLCSFQRCQVLEVLDITASHWEELYPSDKFEICNDVWKHLAVCAAHFVQRHFHFFALYIFHHDFFVFLSQTQIFVCWKPLFAEFVAKFDNFFSLQTNWEAFAILISKFVFETKQTFVHWFSKCFHSSGVIWFRDDWRRPSIMLQPLIFGEIPVKSM